MVFSAIFDHSHGQRQLLRRVKTRHPATTAGGVPTPDTTRRRRRRPSTAETFDILPANGWANRKGQAGHKGMAKSCGHIQCARKFRAAAKGIAAHPRTLSSRIAHSADLKAQADGRNPGSAGAWVTVVQEADAISAGRNRAVILAQRRETSQRGATTGTEGEE